LAFEPSDHHVVEGTRRIEARTARHGANCTRICNVASRRIRNIRTTSPYTSRRRPYRGASRSSYASRKAGACCATSCQSGEASGVRGR
jgi:hypothetical protein